MSCFGERLRNVVSYELIDKLPLSLVWKAKLKGFFILLQGDNGLFAYNFINVLSYGLDIQK